MTDALHEAEKTWKMIYREVVGNQLEVDVGAGGEPVRNYPVQIRRAIKSTAIEFSITGGLAYVPVTFTNIPTYRGYRLETQVDGNWASIDQSVYGNDFWQVDYDAESDTWDVTFTIPLDTPGDQRMTRYYRLVL